MCFVNCELSQSIFGPEFFKCSNWPERQTKVIVIHITNAVKVFKRFALWLKYSNIFILFDVAPIHSMQFHFIELNTIFFSVVIVMSILFVLHLAFDPHDENEKKKEEDEMERRKHYKSMAITISMLPFIQMALSIEWVSVIFTHTHTQNEINGYMETVA